MTEVDPADPRPAVVVVSRTATDRMGDILIAVGECLNAGAVAVAVFDRATATTDVYTDRDCAPTRFAQVATSSEVSGTARVAPHVLREPVPAVETAVSRLTAEEFAARCKGLIPVVPGLVVEVRTPSQSPTRLTATAYEYLEAGATVVILLDPKTESAAVCRAEQFPRRYSGGDVLTLPDVLPGFAVSVRAFFE